MAQYIWQKRRILYPILLAVFLVTIGIVTWYHTNPAFAAVPSAPSVTSPSASATEQHPTSLVLTSSAYSGSPAQTHSDWRITKTSSDCSTGTDTVWESTDDTENLESINVNTLNGTYTGDQTGKNGLKYNTTYYVCVRHANADGDSSWSSEVSFTTEDLSNWSGETGLTITNSGSALTEAPIFIQLDGADIHFASSESDGSDIRFSDSTGTHAFPYFISTFNQSEEAAGIWVRIDSVAGVGDTDITIYYDNSSAADPGETLTGEAVFVEFQNEDDTSSWTNGFHNSPLNIFTTTGDYIRLVDSNNTTRDAGFTLSAASQALDDITFETKIRFDDSTGTDAPLIKIGDGSLSHRYISVFAPNGSNNDAWITYDNGNATAQTIGDGLYALGTEFIYRFDIDESGSEFDHYFYDENYTELATDANTTAAVGSPSDTDQFSIGAYGGNSNRMDGYIDYIAIRETPAVEPTLTASSPVGSVPSAPTISSPTASETGVAYNPTITTSTFSGDGGYLSTDAKIVTTNDCTSGTVVWSATDINAETSFTVNSWNGSFAGDLAGKDALAVGETYYACVRHANFIGDSNWSTGVEFTVETIGPYSYSREITLTTQTATITNSQVYLRLDSSNMSFSNAQTDGGDIRFVTSDQSQFLPYWFETYDNIGETADVYVRVDSLPSSGDVTIYLLYGYASASDSTSCENTMVECVDFEDNSVADWNNTDLTSISITSADQFGGSYAADFYRDSGTGGGQGAEGVGGDAYFVFENGPYTVGTHVIEMMQKNSTTTDTGSACPYESSTSILSGAMCIYFSTSSNIFRYATGTATDTSVNYSVDTYYKSVYYPISTTQWNGQWYTGSDKSDTPHVDIQTVSRYTTASSTDLRGINIQRVDGASHFYLDNLIVRKSNAQDFDEEVTYSIGIESELGAPTVAAPASIVQATDGSGDISFTVSITDLQNDESRLKIEYSDDAGVTWYDPILDSCTPDGGTADLDNSNEYQCGTTDGIDTDTEGEVIVSFIWDSTNASNENGALSGVQDDIQLRVTASDGTNITSAVASDSFSVDYDDPISLADFTATGKLGAVELTWTAATDDNFSHYEIWYGTNQSDVQNRTGTATEWDNGDDTNLATATTTQTIIDGLSSATTYYFKIFAVDDFGNEQTVADQSVATVDIADWDSFAEIKIDNTGNSAHIEQQVRFILTETTNVDSNCNDIRILDFDGVSQLYHWVEECDVAGNNITVWVRIPSIQSNTVDNIFMYYNNPDLDVNDEDPENTFLDFFDESHITGSTNGVLHGGYDTATVSGDYYYFSKAAGNTRRDFKIELENTVDVVDDISMYYNGYWEDSSGTTDRIEIMLADDQGGSSLRYDRIYSQWLIPNTAETASNINGTSLASSFSFSTVYNYKTNIIRSGVSDEVEGYWTDENGGAIDSTTGLSVYDGAPSNINAVHLFTNSGGYVVDFYLDYLFFTKYTAEEPTVSIGDAPDTPSVTVPADAATDISINPVATASTPTNGTAIYADWQISDDGTFSDEDCSDANIVWCKLSSTDNIDSITVNSVNGTFLNARNGYGSLDAETDYWIRVRYKNAGGWSDWSDSNQFTTQASQVPVMSNVSIDSGAASVTLTANSTTEVTVTGTATDDDGCSEITGAELKLYRTDVGSGGSDDDNNLYTVACTQDSGSCTGGADTTATYTCTVDVNYYADATDSGSANEATTWTASVTPSDSATGTADTDTVEMSTLTALTISEASIDFGSLALGADTGATNQDTTIVNTGNEGIDVNIYGYGTTPLDGYAMSCDSGNIPVANMKYNLTTGFTYSLGGTALSDSAVEVDADILQRTSTESSAVMKWGIGIPSTGVGASCSGTIVFAAVSDPNTD